MSFFTLSLPSRTFTKDKENDENRPPNTRASVDPRISQNILTKRNENVRHIGELQGTTPVAAFELEGCAENQCGPENHVTAPSCTGTETSPVRSASSTYAPEGRLSSSLSTHDQSSANSLTHGYLTSISSIEQFCNTRFDLPWTSSYSSTGSKQGHNLMEELEAALGPQDDSDTSIIAVEQKLEASIPCNIEVSPWVAQLSDPSIRLSESELEGIGPPDKHIRGRNFLGARKLAKAFWESRARFLQGIRLGKAKKKVASKYEKSGTNETNV
ncbi:hypothetical protein PG984_009282 [Apiospora sp. TS-2023a]